MDLDRDQMGSGRSVGSPDEANMTFQCRAMVSRSLQNSEFVRGVCFEMEAGKWRGWDLAREKGQKSALRGS
jgi:hypothetical protein